MNMKKAMVGIVTAATLCGTIAAPVMADDAEYKVLIGCSNQAQSFYSWLANSIKKEIDENYSDMTATINDLAGETGNVQTMIELAETGGYNGIIVDAPDETKFTDAYKEALDEYGIYTVRVNKNEDADGVTVNLGLNNYGLGKAIGEVASESLPENASILILGGPAGNVGSDDRLNGFKDALKDAGRDDVTILAEQNAKDWQKESGMTVMEDWTQMYDEDQFDALMAPNDDLACGAIEVCEAAGQDTQRIQFYGIDGLANGCNAVKSGAMEATVLQDCDEQAKEAVKALHEMLTGENTESRYIELEPTLITKDNVDEIIAKHEANGMMK